MNRSILIVICDFLLLSMLALARFDPAPAASAPSAQQVQASEQAAPARTSDLLDTMKDSLEEERLSREKLAEMLAETEDALKSQQQLAAERQEQLQSAAESLRAKEEEARKIEQARNALASEYNKAQSDLTEIQQQLAVTSTEARVSQQRLSAIEQQYAAAQSNLVNMEKELSSTSTEARMARERLAQIENDLRTRQSEADAARQRIEQVEHLRVAAELERERIAGQLKVAETEQRMTQEQLVAAKGQIQTVQQEKEQIQKVATELAEGVVQFAETQGEMAKAQGELVNEIREFRPLTPNTIFASFVSNRVTTDFRANRSGLLGRTISKDSQARTILVNNGTQTYALYHVNDTPFRIEEFGKDWERFIVHLYRGGTILPLDRVHFLSIDPRVVVAPVTDAQAAQLKVQVYKTEDDPLRFQDALIVGADEGYYGECRFSVEAQNPGYLRMDRTALGRLVGKFNPSRGDLVFSKSGDIIGIMVNKQYCAQLTSFVPTATIPTGANLNADAIGLRLSDMQRRLSQMPLDLQ